MKIRQGFVSNSSSSSFIAFGFSINESSNIYKDLYVALGVSAEEFEQNVETKMAKYEMSYQEATREVCFEDYFHITEEKNIRILDGSEDGVKNKETVVALMLEDSSEQSFGQGEISFTKPNSQQQEIMELRNKISPNSEVKIFYGNRSC